MDKQIYNNLKQHRKVPKTKKEYRYYRNIGHFIDYTCRVYRLPRRLFKAILMRESQYQVGALRVTKDKPTDFGIGQIYHKTAKAYGFKKSKLLSNSVYSIRASAKVLKDFKDRYRGKEKYWYLRYNTANKQKQKIYYAHIARYF